MPIDTSKIRVVGGLLKSHVAAHTRIVNGKVVQVAAYDDKRAKRAGGFTTRAEVLAAGEAVKANTLPAPKPTRPEGSVGVENDANARKLAENAVASVSTMLATAGIIPPSGLKIYYDASGFGEDVPQELTDAGMRAAYAPAWHTITLYIGEQSLLHEVGHAVDHMVFGKDGTETAKSQYGSHRLNPGKIDGNPLWDVMTAIYESDAYSYWSDGPGSKEMLYAIDPREMFARAFEQYVYGENAADPDKWAAWQKRFDERGQAHYWNWRDFAPIQKAFKAVFTSALQAQLKKSIEALLKSHVKAHTRTLASGKVVQVAAHDDKRTRATVDVATGRVNLQVGGTSNGAAGAAQGRTGKPSWEMTAEETQAAWHDDVEQLLKEGKFVPKEDLREFPDLVKKYKTLTPAEDYKQNGTRAASFKAWFGEWESDPANASKVVTTKGFPRVVYHSTRADSDFAEFDLGRTTEGIPSAWFSPDKRYAEEYAGKAKPFYLNVRKPLDLRKETMFEYPGDMPEKTIPEWMAIFKKHGLDVEWVDDPEDWEDVGVTLWDLTGGNEIPATSATTFHAALLSQGFDAIWHNEQDRLHRPVEAIGIISSATQIKAVANEGGFDPHDSNIYKSIMEQLNTLLKGVTHGYTQRRGAQTVRVGGYHNNHPLQAIPSVEKRFGAEAGRDTWPLPDGGQLMVRFFGRGKGSGSEQAFVFHGAGGAHIGTLQTRMDLNASQIRGHEGLMLVPRVTGAWVASEAAGKGVLLTMLRKIISQFGALDVPVQTDGDLLETLDALGPQYEIATRKDDRAANDGRNLFAAEPEQVLRVSRVVASLFD